MATKPVICAYCKKPAQLVSGSVIYPFGKSLADLKFWSCKPCDAYVGCHKPGHGQGDGTKPLGRLANASLREAKKRAHAAFDPLWQSGAMRRVKAYAWLAKKLRIPIDKTHIGSFDEAMCERVIQLCQARLAQIETAKKAQPPETSSGV